MGLDRIIHVMRLEGIAYGEDIGTDLLGGAPTGNWAAQVDQIYDEDRMMQMLHTELATELDGVDTDSIVAFFTSETGAKVVDLEIAAREALLDDAVEEASREAAIVAMADGDPRVVQVERFIHANDLIESNVVGAMNSNYAYFMGLLDGGALPAR